MSVGNVVLPSTTDINLAAVIEKFGLPADSKPSAVLQHIVDTSGHMVSLKQLIAVAHCIGADVQLYITDSEEVPPHPVG